MNYEDKVRFHDPGNYETERILDLAMLTRSFIAYRPGEIYCSKCNQYKKVTKDELKQIRAARLCPMCHRTPHRFTMTEEDAFRTWIRNGRYGYKVFVKWIFGKPLCHSITQVLFFDGSNAYRRYCVKGMFGVLCETSDPVWRRSDAEKYKNYLYSLDYSENWITYDDPEKTKRVYYEDLKIQDLKTNQIEIMKKNLLNEEQVRYLKHFDLKSYDEIYRNRAYIKKNPISELRAIKGNIHLLEYLRKNKIPLNDYFDYAEQCNYLGFKLDRPKDFQFRHEQLSKMIKIKQDEDKDRKIRRRLKRLETLSNGNVIIQPFANCQEIITAGKTLHNCIGQYCERYADGKTDLYHLDIDGVMIACIEVKCGKLIQAREDHNKTCTLPIIKEFERRMNERSTIQTARNPQALS